MSKKRLLISVDSLHDGGAELFAIRLANQLVSKYEVFFLEFDSRDSKNRSLLNAISAKVTFFSPSNHWALRIVNKIQKLNLFTSSANALFFRIRLMLIQLFIWKNKITIINSHAILQNYSLGLLKSRLPSLKIILTLHGHYELLKLENFENYQRKLSFDVAFVDRVIYLTNEQLSNFTSAGFESQKAIRILNGFDLEYNYTSITKDKNSNNHFSLLILSRAIVEKGWIQAIEACLLLKQKGYSLKLILVGGGPDFDMLKKMYVSEDIIFTGFTFDVKPFLREADLGLLPSYYHAESLPNSIVECLAFGIPVIASTIGAIPEMLAVEDKIAGDLIKTTKGIPVNVEVLSKLIEKYILDHQYLISKKNLTQLAFNKFKMSECLKNYENVFFEQRL